MKKPVRKVAMFVVVLFTLIVLNLNYLQVIRADSLATAPGNNRVLLQEYARQRGSIVVDGTPIAVSKQTDDKLKYLRTYPKGAEYAAVTGFYSIVYGSTGIEDIENDVLAGSDDRMFGSTLADLFSGRDRKGGNVVLTINPAAQDAAYQALTQAKVTGSVVAIDPSTGAILALVSTPAYDPNTLSTHNPDGIRSAYAALDKQNPNPLSNQAIGQTYPPGSIFKVIVSAAALEDGLTPQTQIPAPQVYTLPGTQTGLKNFNGEQCSASGQQTLLEALTISCNTAFAELAAEKLGKDKVAAMAAKFGIGQELDIPLTVADSKLGEIPDAAALAQSAIGQRDVQLTALQAAMISSTVANNGELMKPYLVAETQRPDLSVLDKAEPEPMADEPAFSPQTAAGLKEMMVSVINNGTGKKAQLPGIQVAGKTGTAEISKGVSPHAWFTGFAPVDSPKIAIGVFIKNGGNSAGETTTGGDISAPIAQQVMAAFFNAGGGG